jgi:hypothetical protein
LPPELTLRHETAKSHDFRFAGYWRLNDSRFLNDSFFFAHRLVLSAAC